MGDLSAPLRERDPKAIVALGHEILVAAYRVLDTGQPYLDPGPETFNAATAERERRRALDKLHRLGYDVTLTPSA